MTIDYKTLIEVIKTATKKFADLRNAKEYNILDSLFLQKRSRLRPLKVLRCLKNFNKNDKLPLIILTLAIFQNTEDTSGLKKTIASSNQWPQILGEDNIKYYLTVPLQKEINGRKKYIEFDTSLAAPLERVKINELYQMCKKGLKNINTFKTIMKNDTLRCQAVIKEVFEKELKAECGILFSYEQIGKNIEQFIKLLNDAYLHPSNNKKLMEPFSYQEPYKINSGASLNFSSEK